MSNDFSSLLASADPKDSLFRVIGGGLLRGVRKDPFARPIVDRISALVGFDDMDRELFLGGLERGTTGRISEFVGEFAPLIAGSLVGFGAGQAAVRGAAGLVGRGALRQGATTGIRGQFAQQAARQQASNLDARKFSAIEALARENPNLPFAQHAAKMARESGLTGIDVPKPGLIRGLEVAGAAAGEGTFMGAREYAGTGDIEDSVKEGLLIAALSGTLQGGVIGIGRALKGKEVPFSTVAERPEFIAAKKQLYEEVSTLQEKQIAEINTNIRKILGIKDVEINLEQAILQKGQRRVIETLKKKDKLGRTPIPGPQQIHLEIEKMFKEVSEEVRKRRAVRGASRDGDPVIWDSLINQIDGSIVYTRDTPLNPDGMTVWMQQILTQLVRSPESYEGKMGIVLTQLLRNWRNAEAEHIAGSTKAQQFVSDLRSRMSKATGIGLSGKNDQTWRELGHAWEGMGGEDSVRTYLSRKGVGTEGREEVIGIFKELEEEMIRIYQPMERMGAQRMLSKEEMRQMGVSHFLPHLLKDTKRESMSKILDRLSRRKDIPPAMLKRIRESMDLGLPRFGSTDFNRNLGGTLLENVTLKGSRNFKDGVPFIDDFWQASYMYLAGVNRRNAYAKRFGMLGVDSDFDNKVILAIKDAVKKEGAGDGLTNTLVDAVFDTKLHDAALRRMSSLFVSAEIASKLTFAVIPNLTQPINTAMLFGFRNMMKGMHSALSDVEARDVLQASAVSDSIFSGLGRATKLAKRPDYESGSPTMDTLGNAADRFAELTLTWTGFSTVEKWNRIITGYAARSTFMEILSKGVAGKLRGETLVRSRRMMSRLGADLDQLVIMQKTGRLTPDMVRQAEVTAIQRGVQTTQFTPMKTTRPLWWSTPSGQVIFQFKNYALGQSRFLSDAVFKEAAHGNMKPLAYFASIYPVAGEFVKDVRSVLVGKDRESNGYARLIENFTAVGGLGLVTDAFTASKFGRLSEFLFGPTVGDMTQVAQEIMSADANAVRTHISRQPAFKASQSLFNASVWTARAGADYVESLDTEYSPLEQADQLPSLKDLVRRQAAEK